MLPFRPIPTMFGAVAAALALSHQAGAKPARCFTTDDGYYACDFKALDSQGSFAISAPMRPTYSLWVDRPGFAAGFVDLGGRNIALPGMSVRQRDDAAC